MSTASGQSMSLAYDGAGQSVGWIGTLMANFETGKAYCDEARVA